MTWTDYQIICGKFLIDPDLLLDDPKVRKIVKESLRAKTEKEKDFYLQKLEKYITEEQ